MRRGDLYWADLPSGRHPVVILTRTTALPFLTDVTAATITSTLRDIPSHVRVDERYGLHHESDINCDALIPIRVAELTEPIGTLDDHTRHQLDTALRFALDLDATP